METFPITVSVRAFDNKPPKSKVGGIEYEAYSSCTIDDIASWISNGYALSANVKHVGEFIKQADRTVVNFESIPFVFFDVDNDVTDDLDVLCSKLEFKPTIAYTTYSHRTTDPQKGYLGNRYRLLYVFNEQICDVQQYKNLYANLNKELGFSVSDKCGKNPVQAIFGSNRTFDGFMMVRSEVTYDINEVAALGCSDEGVFTDWDESNITVLKSLPEARSNDDSNDTFVKKATKRPKVIQCSDFVMEYSKLSIHSIKYLTNKYSDVYELHEQTKLPDVSEDIPYIIYPEDYCEIRVAWMIEPKKDKYGNVLYMRPVTRRWRDGENRRGRLFLNGLRRRIMTNDTITFDNLLYCMMHEFYHNYERTDIDLKCIYKKAEEVWNTDLDAYKEKLTGLYRKQKNGEYKRRRYCINRKYCIKYGVTPQQANGKAQGLLRGIDEKIGSMYDPSLTDKENIEVFKEYGLEISLLTLKRWRKKNGITKYTKKEK